ncbi:MAG: endo-1,4-beta-xylanase [Sedimentisphaerales bacterium]|nr:endo-1,4-beta-xylanase [Sedimentisphaerales bacterium]
MKFQVFKNGKSCSDFVISAAYMFGADTIPLHATEGIRFAEGHIECKRKSHDAAGLALLWPINGMGRLLLPTTRLPERERPYILNIELARAKLMQITLKQEDWSLFEEDNELSRLAREARLLFISSLEHISNPGKASQLADQCLSKALEYSERLAVQQGEAAFTTRCKAKGLGRHSLGCRVDPKMLDEERYGKWLFDMFGFVTMPINWARIEPERGQYDFTELDRCIEKLCTRRVAICGGPVLQFSKEYLPSWLLHGKQEFERIRETAYGFVSKIIGRYGKYVHAWRVISGMNAVNYFGFSFEQAIEMTRTAILASRAADAKSRKLVEILYPWGEYYAQDRNTIPPLVYADMVIQSGISFDAYGLEMHFGKDLPGMHLRDMMQISSRLDCFAQVAKPVHITGIAVPDVAEKDEYGTDRAGFWHKEWDGEIQGLWIDQFYRIALGKPFIQSVTYSSLADSDDMDLPNSGLLNRQLEPKKAFLALARFQKAILRK